MMTHIQGLHRIVRQRGQTLILVLLLLSVAVGAALFSYYRSNKIALDYDRKTTEALAQAKAALVGYAVSRGDITGSARPGEFPCPDTKAPADVNYGYQDGSCTAGRLGRIPWKTLGIPEPKDASGETLWYVVADRFRPTSTQNLNSDTLGSITVYAADGSTLLANATNQNPQAAAVVLFAPGPALGSQIRDATSAACATTGTSIPRSQCAANYLDTSAGRNNATTNGPFIAGASSDNYNDRVLYITTAEFIPNVEQRVARELKAALQTYYNANAHYPFAAAYNDTSGDCKKNVRRGRVPVFAGNCNAMSSWSNSLPDWFKNNRWWQVMYYAVSPDYGKKGADGDDDDDDKDDDNDKDKDKDRGRHNSNLDCGGGCLTVDGSTAISALFFTPGTPRGAISRPSNNLVDYLEDAQNQDGWGSGANDIYVTPTAKTFDRDRIYTLAGGMSTAQCANNATALLRRLPCGKDGNSVDPQCSTASANLQVCACAAAATTLVNSPCTNTLNPSQCQSARDSLRTACGASGSDDDDKDK